MEAIRSSETSVLKDSYDGTSQKATFFNPEVDYRIHKNLCAGLAGQEPPRFERRPLLRSDQVTTGHLF
jgi:hypothetical protein